MTKKLTILAAALFLLAGCGSPFRGQNTTGQNTTGQGSQNQDPSKQYVVIFSLDAFRWDLKDKYETPALDSVMTVGVWSEIKPCFPANTFPNHYSMATGLYPDHHGIVNNSFYDKNLKANYSISNTAARENPAFYYGEPIWKTVERQGKVANVFGWVGLDPYVATTPASQIKGRKHAYDSRLSRRQLVDEVLESICKTNVSEIPDLVMCYFAEPDHTLHQEGVDSRGSGDMVADVDAAIRYLLREAKKSPVYDKINFIFTADHGMTDLSNDRRTNVYDYLKGLGVDVYYNNSNPLSIEPKNESKTQVVYETLKKHEAEGHYTVYLRDQMPEKYHYGTCSHRIYPIIVNPECGWRVYYGTTSSTNNIKANHGFAPENRDMHMSFFAFGPAFKRGYSHNVVFENLNDHYIIARLLGVNPADNNDCRPEDVEGLFVK